MCCVVYCFPNFCYNWVKKNLVDVRVPKSKHLIKHEPDHSNDKDITLLILYLSSMFGEAQPFSPGMGK